MVPAYNEAATVSQVVGALTDQGWRVVVVDDGSSDETVALASEAGARVLHHIINRGQGAALQTGISFALQMGAEFIVTFDSDGQHDAGALPSLIEPLVTGRAQVALGSRFLGSTEGIPFGRAVLLRMAVLFTRATTGLAVTDAHNGLRAFTARAASSIEITLDRMAHASELLDQIAASRMPVVEVPVHIRYTDYSRSKGQRSTAAVKIMLDYLLRRLFGV